MSANLPPILEFDPDRGIILNPTCGKVEADGCTCAVACFFGDVLDHLAGTGILLPAGSLGSELGRIPVYHIAGNKPPIMAYLAGQGAPFSVQLFEKMIAAGVKRFVAVSGCGALREDLNPGEILVLESAVRDEGTSYHYLPPSREVNASPVAIHAVTRTLETRQIPFRLAKTWSTDAIFRETPARRATRLADDCQVVEMEAAALYAVAQYRDVEIVQIAYAGDLVIPGRWDKRGWDERFDDRLRLFNLAVEALATW
jgi:purine-nucleoside phosphorylase